MVLHPRSPCLHLINSLLLMNLFSPNNVANAFGNETDRFALLKFKESIASDPNGFLSSWNDSSHFCSWSGVSCSRRHQRVIALKIPGQDLHGTISPYIGNLSFLRSINLSRNSFSGKIPQQVDRLLRLQNLTLENNTLDGEIPDNLTSCRELSRLSLGLNRLSGKIPSETGSMMKLAFLGLSNNNLTGGIPPSLGNLSSIMTTLSLSDNNLVGQVPEEIGRLGSLSYFGVGRNNLSGTIPPSLFNISSMKFFQVTMNKFQGSIPTAIGLNMPNLQRVYLGLNEFSGQIPASISNASQLEWFEIVENNFVGNVPRNFGNCPELLHLSLSVNNLGSHSANDLDFITSLKNCSKLDNLGFDNNKFGGVLPNSIANLSSNLEYLYLAENQISGTIPTALENYKKLILLNLNNNLFTGVIPTSIGKLRNLQFLDLFGNRLSGRIPSSLGNLTQLYFLTLSKNKLEGNIPQSLGNLQNLQKMLISTNSLTGNIPVQVFGLSSLLYLDISKNSLTGSLPLEVGKLKNVHTLDISENKLIGEIPEIIGDSQGLEFLQLQGNRFQGLIPSSLASLKGLQYLDLSRNNLSGQIPKDLQNLTFLLYLNLSLNNLEGEVPNKGVFRNTSGTSLVGNTKLCGVSDLKLPACPTKLPGQRNSHGFKLKFTIAFVAGCSLLLSFLCALIYWRRTMRKEQLPAAVSSIEFLPKVSYKTLYEATGGFSEGTVIGSGGFGSVYKGVIDQEEGNAVAIKVLNLQLKGASKSFIAECNALRNIRHKNLVKILTCCSSMDYNGNEFKALVYEYMSNGSLEEWLHTANQSRSLNLYQRLNIAIDTAVAVCYLHEQFIIHRDLKPSNVLLDHDMIAHVGDFGLAKFISTTADSSQNRSSTIAIKGTIGYAAPEYAIGVEPSRQGDAYSYGILVLEMFTGRRPTAEMFKDGLNLHNFVKMAIPGRLVQIVDPALVAAVEEAAPAATANEVNKKESGHSIEIGAEEGNKEHESKSSDVWKCVHEILKIGVACSEESPKNRMSMEDVVRDLHHLRNTFYGTEISRERRSRS